MDINTEAFIQSAAMQIKAQNAPGSFRSRQTSAPSIYKSAIIFLIMLVFYWSRNLEETFGCSCEVFSLFCFPRRQQSSAVDLI